jgi:hypothetical protein
VKIVAESESATSVGEGFGQPLCFDKVLHRFSMEFSIARRPSSMRIVNHVRRPF